MYLSDILGSLILIPRVISDEKYLILSPKQISMDDIFQKTFLKQVSRIIEKYEDFDDSLDEIIDIASNVPEKVVTSPTALNHRLSNIFYASNRRKRNIRFDRLHEQ